MMTHMNILLKNGRTRVKGMKEFRELEALATEMGYKIEGTYNGRVDVKLIGGRA